MKIRGCFVSNSSSCSFVLPHGTDIDVVKNSLEKVIEAVNIIRNDNKQLDDMLTITTVGDEFINEVKEWNQHSDSELNFYTYNSDSSQSKQSIKGTVVINSKRDNSIPPEIMRFIEHAFGWQTKHFHWG